MTVGTRMFLPKSYCWKPAADQSQSPCYIPLVTASDSSGHVITELDQRKGRRRLGPMDRGEEKHSHISNLPHPSFHVQLIHGDIESIPRNPRDIIYLVSPGSTWSTFRRCQGDLRQLMWRSSDSTMNPSQMTKFLILSVRKLISSAAVWIRRRLGAEVLQSSASKPACNSLDIIWVIFENCKRAFWNPNRKCS